MSAIFKSYKQALGQSPEQLIIKRESSGPKVIIGTEQDAYTVLLLHGDGNDGSTTITDEAGKTVTVVGNTCLKTAVKKFGSSSIYFDGSGDYLRLADSSDFDFGSGDFTIDCWVYFLTMPTGNNYPNRYTIFVDGPYGSVSQNGFYVGNNGIYFTITDSTYAVSGTHSMVTGQWYHLAVVRHANMWNIYINGTSVASATYTAALPVYTNAVDISADNSGDAANYKGYIDEYRISKGIARWTAGFVPPTDPFFIQCDVQKFSPPLKIKADDEVNIIRGLKKGMEYKAYEDSVWTTYDPVTPLPDLSKYKVMQVRYKASGNIKASDPVTLYFSPDDTRDLISVAQEIGIDFVKLCYLSKKVSENVSTSVTDLSVAFIKVFYTSQNVSESVSASVTGLSVTLTSV